MRLGLVLVVAGAFCVLAQAAELPEAPPRGGYPLIDDFAYANDEAAHAAWVPMRESASVRPVPLDGRNALHMPCNLSAPDMPRASWDHAVTLDLSVAQGVQFLMYCPDTSPVSYFSIYFESGEGWYSRAFAPSTPGEWNLIQIEKSEAHSEGKPAGWAVIKRIRISAWKAVPKDTALYVADLGLWGANAEIAVVRGDYAMEHAPAEKRGIEQFLKTVTRPMSSLDLPYVVVSDKDLDDALLAKMRVAVLPYNPSLPDAAVDALARFIQRGGKLVSFYMLDRRLQPLVGIRVGNHLPAAYTGQYASIRPAEASLAGMPAATGQLSWNISEAAPADASGRVLAMWHDAKGELTGRAAIVAGANGIHMTHVVLTDDPMNKRVLLLAMLAHFVPAYAQKAAGSAVETAGAVGPYTTFDEAHEAIGAAATHDIGRHALAEAVSARLRAEGLLLEGKSFEALAAAGQASDLMIRAYCAVQRPVAGEQRGWWCHSAFGVDGMSWDDAIRNLAENGFTAIFPNMLWGGAAFYESSVLPVSPEIGKERDGVVRGDQIAECLAACKKYGVACHVWKVNWNTGSCGDPAFLKQIAQEGRTQVAFDGTPEPKWLCPSHPVNQQLEIDAMVEVATKYDVDGIHFDYIRYPDENHCFCAGCKARFEKALGKPVPIWPASVRTDENLKQRWNDFRRAQITAVVAGASERVRASRPAVKISAAVFYNLTLHRDSVAQDWGIWCEKGYLDFVCPMDYQEHDSTFESMVREQVALAGKAGCYPGIGLSVWGDPIDACKLISQIEITRKYGTRGFTIFNYGVAQAQSVVPLCGLGITRPE